MADYNKDARPDFGFHLNRDGGKGGGDRPEGGQGGRSGDRRDGGGDRRGEQGGGADRPAGGPPKKPLGKRSVTFSMSVSKLAAAIVALTLIIVWVFILGILLGRGFEPEAHIPELDRIMPKTQDQGSATAGGEAGVSEYQEGSESDKASAEGPGSRTVIPEAYLNSRQSLKSPSGGRPAAPTRQAQATLGQSASGQTSAQTQQGQGQHSQAGQNGALQTPPAGQNQARAGTPASGQENFTYVYQVAASKNEQASKDFAARLKADGHTASVETSESNGAVWHRVLITFRGTPDDTETLRKQLASHRIDRLILRSKTPSR